MHPRSDLERLIEHEHVPEIGVAHPVGVADALVAQDEVATPPKAAIFRIFEILLDRHFEVVPYLVALVSAADLLEPPTALHNLAQALVFTAADLVVRLKKKC